MAIEKNNNYRLFLGPMNYPTIAFGQVYNTTRDEILIYLADYKFIQKAVTQNSSTTTVPVATSSLIAGVHYDMQGPVLGNTTDVSFLQEVYLAPSGFLKADQAGNRCFLVNLGLISLCPAAKVCDVFCNRAYTM